MTLQPQLIAPFESGLVNDIEPWLAPPDSFQEIDNFHVRHGTVEKRNGYTLFGYMAYSLPDDTFEVPISNITQADPGVVTSSIPHGFSNGDYVSFYEVQGMTQINNQRYQITYIDPTSFSIGDTSAANGFSAYTGGGVFIWSPTNPIMGLARYLKSDNTYDFLIFDTQRASIYNSADHRFNPINDSIFLSVNDIFDGSDEDYVWTWQWQAPSASLLNRLYFTNGLPRDVNSVNGIYFYPNEVANVNYIDTLLPFVSPLDDSRQLVGAKLIFTLADRLLVFNTYEGVPFNPVTPDNTINYPQRVRWCKNKDPSSWREGADTGGGFLDAATGDHIISGRALKDSIIIFFTNSVWVLRYAIGNPALPFRWYKLNDFRACGGKMASVGYDQQIRCLGTRGITGTDYTQTQRIDDHISQFVVDNINTDTFEKVFCERSYAEQRWWTLFPKQTTSEDDEDKGVLINDDDSFAYSTYSLPINALGYANLSFDYGFDDFTAENNLDINWLQTGSETFASSQFQLLGEVFMGGSTDGVIYNLERTGADNNSDITSTLTTAYWNPYKEAGIECQMSYVDLYLDSQYNTTATISFFKNDDDDPYGSQSIDMLPDLGYIASIGDILNTNPCIVEAPGHGLSTGQTIFIYLVEGMDEVNDRQFTVTVINDYQFSLDGIDATNFGTYEINGQIVLREFYTTKVWKRAFAGGIGYQHCIRIDTTGANCPMKIHGLKPYFKPRGKRTVN